jgi:phenylacetate-coenzyme A ligase PaaK-like adenylate-forming protein
MVYDQQQPLPVEQLRSVDALRGPLTPQLGQENDSARLTLSLMRRYPERRGEIAVARIGGMVDFARAHAPFYSRHWKDIQGRDLRTEADLQHIPVVTKENYVEHTQQYSEARAAGNPFPQTDFMTRPLTEGVSIWFSGGSTSFRTTSLRTPQEWRTYVDFAAETMWPRYFQQGETVGVYLYPSSGWSGAQIFGDINRSAQGIASVQIFPSDDPNIVLEIMRDFGVNALFAQPEALINPKNGLVPAILAANQQNPERQVNLNKVVYGGSAMYPDQIRYLQNAGIEPYGIYSQTEVGPIGIQPVNCPSSRTNDVYHSTALNHFWTQEVDGESRVIVSNLVYAGLPVVAYENRDTAAHLNHPCDDCGQPVFQFMGRMGEDVQVGAYKFRGTPLWSAMFAQLQDLGIVIPSTPQVQMHRGEQDDTFRLRVVLPGIDDATAAALQANGMQLFMSAAESVFGQTDIGQRKDLPNLRTRIVGVDVSTDPDDISAKNTGKIPRYADLRGKNEQPPQQ